MDETRHLREKCQQLEKMVDILKQAILEIRDGDPIKQTKHSYYLIAAKAIEDVKEVK